MLVGEPNTYSTELKHLETNRFETANLYAKHLITITDSQNYAGDVSVLKALTGQDTVPFEEKQKRGWIQCHRHADYRRQRSDCLQGLHQRSGEKTHHRPIHPPLGIIKRTGNDIEYADEKRYPSYVDYREAAGIKTLTINRFVTLLIELCQFQLNLPVMREKKRTGKVIISLRTRRDYDDHRPSPIAQAYGLPPPPS